MPEMMKGGELMYIAQLVKAEEKGEGSQGKVSGTGHGGREDNTL